MPKSKSRKRKPGNSSLNRMIKFVSRSVVFEYINSRDADGGERYSRCFIGGKPAKSSDAVVVNKILYLKWPWHIEFWVTYRKGKADTTIREIIDVEQPVDIDDLLPVTKQAEKDLTDEIPIGGIYIDHGWSARPLQKKQKRKVA